MKKINETVLLIIILSMGLLLSCSQNTPVSNTNKETSENKLINTSIAGKVDFSELSQALTNESDKEETSLTTSHFTIKATLAEIGLSSTVSIIYPHNYSDVSMRNVTVASSVTKSDGTFIILPNDTFHPAVGDIFILEAIKRIGGAGQKLLTIRTYIRWKGFEWESITYPGLFINSKTTAMVLMAEYRGVSSDNIINKIQMVDGNGIAQDVNAQITAANVFKVVNLVDYLLQSNRDPVEYVKYDSSADNYVINNPVSLSTPTLICHVAFSGNLATGKSVAAGSSDQLSGRAECVYDTVNSINTNISWTTSDSTIASVSNTGLVSGLKLGKATIKATYVNEPTISSSIEITVYDPLGNEYRGLLAENLLYQPRGIDVRSSQIFVSDYDQGLGAFNVAEGQFRIMDISGNITKTIQGGSFDSLPGELNGIASDGLRIWVMNRITDSSNNLYSFDLLGENRLNAKIGTTNTDFVDMAIDPQMKALYIASRGVNNIIKVNYDSNGAIRMDTQQLYFAGATPIYPAGICTDDLGNVFVTNSAANPPTIIKYARDGAKVLEFNSTGKNATGPVATKIGDISYDPLKGGIIYVLAQVGTSNVILRYDSNGNFIRQFGEIAAMSDPRGIATGADGTTYVTDYAKNALHQFSYGR